MNKKKETKEDVQKTVHHEDQATIKVLLFSQVDKPTNLHEIRITNVFEDKYRINVWVRVEEDKLEKKKIGASYFVKYDGENLKIIV